MVALEHRVIGAVANDCMQDIANLNRFIYIYIDLI